MALGIKVELLPPPAYEAGFLNWAQQNFVRIQNAVGRSLGGTISATEPNNPNPGDLWVNTTRETLEVYYSSRFWVVASFDEQTWSPVVTQSVTVTRVVAAADFQYQGAWIMGEFLLNFNGAGTANNAIHISTPEPIQSVAGTVCGLGRFFDSSAGVVFRVQAVVNAGKMYLESTTADTGAFFGADAAVFNGAVASGDTLSLQFRYKWDNS